MTLEKYVQEMRLQHKRPNTLRNIHYVLTPINEFKPLDTCTPDDLKAYIEKYNKDFEAKYKRTSEQGNIYSIYAILKKYYRWAGKPETVSWVKTKTIIKKINPNELLTAAEIQSMLRLWHRERDKCMVAMGYESGMRLGELLSLGIKDLKLEAGECKVRIPDNHEGEHVNAKTGSRTLILIESIPYIEKYLAVHPGGDRLFPISADTAKDTIKIMATRAGITKNVYWHLLRHTRATEMARLGMQETAMKKRFGWTEDSGMIKRYTSLTDEDADNSYREALGLGIKKKDMAINPIARRCAKCGKLVETGEYCQQCSEIQKLTEANTKAAIEKENMKAQMERQDASMDELRKQMAFISNAMRAKGME